MTWNMIRRAGAFVAAAALMLGATAANAFTVNTSGGAGAFSWSYNTGVGVTITGTGTVTTSIVNNNLVLAFTLNNTTVLLNPTDNTALVSFGFGISPNATSVSLSNTVDNGLAGTPGDLNSAGLVTQQGSTKIPSLQGIELCAYGVLGGNCSGGAVAEGIQAGQSDAFSLILGGTWGSSVTIDPLGFKFQGTYGSFEFYGDTDTDTDTDKVPEPGTLALLGLGLVGLGALRRRKA